jgi:hypothetical protein
MTQDEIDDQKKIEFYAAGVAATALAFAAIIWLPAN